MAIWLGKQYLGQREPVQQIQTAHVNEFAHMSDEELDAEIRKMDRQLDEFRRTSEPIKLSQEVRRIANGHNGHGYLAARSSPLFRCILCSLLG
jgi:hypothetical protein